MRKSSPPRKALRKMKKFRFVLLHQWIVKNFLPCRVADIGGGKGFLSYLLNQDGFQCTVIDPHHQALPGKYKDLNGVKHKIPEGAKVNRLNLEFQPDLAPDFDLLIGLHAHGSNLKIIEASAKYHKNFILLPCCVIDEPIEKKPGINWFESLENQAQRLGLPTERFELNFRGQNFGFYAKLS